MRRNLRPLMGALGLWVFIFFLSMKWGVVSHPDWTILLDLRLPRVLLAATVGMGLAVAGAVLQSLFANPLCEPYTLGISSGAALGAVLGISSGFFGIYSGVAGAAFFGAMIFAGILDLISMKRMSSNTTLLLAGIMLTFLGNSLLSLWIVFSDTNGLVSVMAWLFGDLSRARLQGALISLVIMGLAVALIWGNWRSLDAFLLGEEDALALGIDVRQVRRKIIFLTSAIVGLCVSAGGMIGFVGLVVPHFVRRSVGSLHLRLIPFCAIWGATVLMVADLLSRVLLSPLELPVGVVTALVGSPLFLWVMLKKASV